MLILQCFRSSDTFGASSNSFVVNASGIINKESDILDSISVSLEFLVKLSISCISRVKGRCESKDNLSILNNMCAEVS